MNSLIDGGNFLINSLFSLYILFLLIRFWMHVNNADFRNPVGAFLVQVSNPLLLPFKSLISHSRGFALAVLLLALAFTLLKLFILQSLQGSAYSLPGLMVLSVADVVQTSIYIFLVALIIRALSSWIAPQGGYNPFLSIVFTLSEPIMAPARRIIPPISGFDLSPILVIIFLQLSLIIIVQPLITLGNSLL